MVWLQSTDLAPVDFPAPVGSYWEKSGSRHSRLVRLRAEWRETVRQLTALRALEVGVSSWEFMTDTPYLAWVGRWSSRHETMRCLEVAVDGQIIASLQLEGAVDDRTVCLFDGLDGSWHHVQICFPPTTTLELPKVIVKAGAVFTTPPRRTIWCSWGDSITQGTLCQSARESYVQIVARTLGWTSVNR